MKVRVIFVTILVTFMFLGCSLQVPKNEKLVSGGQATELSGEDKAPLTGSVEFYTGKNFTGSKLTFTWGINNIAKFPSTFQRTISSFKIAGGARALFFEGERYLYRAQYFESDSVADMSANGKDFDNKAMSVVFVLPESSRTIQEVAILSVITNARGDETKRYVSANVDLNDAPICANRYVRGPWEEFDLIFLDKECIVFALRAKANNRYVCRDLHKDNIALYANRDGIGLWEMFTFFPYQVFTNVKGIISDTSPRLQLHSLSSTTVARITVSPELPNRQLYSEIGSRPWAIDYIYVQNLRPQNSFNIPLLVHPYTADPSAHLFDGKIFLYCSHDADEEPQIKSGSDSYMMRDYYVYSMDSPTSPVKSYYELGAEPNGITTPSLKLENIQWAKSQLWAPDATKKGSTYYFYFPAKATEQVSGCDVFRIGVATASTPYGPFTAEANYIQGTFSIDPCVFEDNGNYYIIFGGLWGGQRENWSLRNGQWVFDPNAPHPEINPYNTNPVLGPIIARLNSDMKSLAETPREILLYESDGSRMLYSNVNFVFFEGPWLNKVNGKYYLTYSTGQTHNIVCAVSDNIYGPYTNTGVIILSDVDPNICWTTHHSIIQFNNKWYLFYQNSDLGTKVDYKRNIRVKEINFPPQ